MAGPSCRFTSDCRRLAPAATAPRSTAARRSRRAGPRFLAAWTGRLHKDDYVSGVYSSASSGIRDLAIRYRSDYRVPDDIWIANWDGRRTTDDPYVPDSYWSNHQRIRQYRGGHTETYRGVSINIDSNYLDGAVAGAADRDADGLPNEFDLCTRVVGPVENSGCPYPSHVSGDLVNYLNSVDGDRREGDHFTTTGGVGAAYRFQSNLGFLLNQQLPGTVPLYSCSANRDQFLSRAADCRGAKVLGRVGFAYLRRPGGIPTRAIYRCRLAAADELSVSYEPDCGNPDNTNEGRLGFTISVATLGRYLNSVDGDRREGDHFTTTGGVGAAYRFQSNLGFLLNQQLPGTVPLYSCSANRDQFLSRAADCRGAKVLGRVGFAYLRRPGGIPTRAIYRCRLAAADELSVSYEPDCGNPDDTNEGRLGFTISVATLGRYLNSVDGDRREGDHFTTTGGVGAAYRFQSNLGFLLNQQLPGTVPLYSCSANRDQFLSRAADCRGAKVLGRVGFAYLRRPGGIPTRAIYRCRLAAADELSVSYEPDCGNPDNTNEGRLGFTISVATLGRYLNSVDGDRREGDHFTTTGGVGAAYRFQSNLGFLLNQQLPGTVPLYSCSANRDQFLSRAADCRGAKVLGRVGFAYLRRPGGIPTRAIYRCRLAAADELSVSYEPDCGNPDDTNEGRLGFTISVATLGRYLNSVDGDRREGDHFTTTGGVGAAYRFQSNLGFLLNQQLPGTVPLYSCSANRDQFLSRAADCRGAKVLGRVGFAYLRRPGGIPTRAIYRCRLAAADELSVSYEPDCGNPDNTNEGRLGFTISVATLGRYLNSVDGDRREGDHFTTTGGVGAAYRFQSNLGFLLNQQLPGTVPLYSCSANRDQFLSRAADCRGAKVLGRVGFAYLRRPGGIPTRAIYRCRLAAADELSVSYEPDCGNPDNTNEGRLGFTISVATLGRYLNSVDGDRREGDHFTTTGGVGAAYRFQSNLGFLLNQQLPGTVPLYSCSANRDQFLSRAADCRGAKVLGRVGFAYLRRPGGIPTRAIYRCRLAAADELSVSYEPDCGNPDNTNEGRLGFTISVATLGRYLNSVDGDRREGDHFTTTGGVGAAYRFQSNLGF